MAGNDIRSMNDETRDILTNKEVIAVDQDPEGKQGHRVKRNGDADVWAREMSDGSRAVVLLNRGNSEERITVDWTDIGYPAPLRAAVRDLWAHKSLDPTKGSFSASVPSHGVVMLLIHPE
jgi:alpha-galactosidase